MLSVSNDLRFVLYRVPPAESLFDPYSTIMMELPAWEENAILCTCKFNDKEENRVGLPNRETNVADCSNKGYNVCSVEKLQGQRKREFKCSIQTNKISRRRREVSRRMRRSADNRFKRSENEEV